MNLSELHTPPVRTESQVVAENIRLGHEGLDFLGQGGNYLTCGVESHCVGLFRLERPFYLFM
jgi:hypothetical protein